MVDILSPSGLETPAGGELHSRAMLSRNNQRLNNGYVIMNQASGTISGVSTASKFTRIRVGPTAGIVIAHIVCTIPGTVALPANTAANTTIASGFVPPGYMPAATVGNSVGVLSGAGRGDLVNFQITTAGTLTMRSAAAGFTTTSGVSLIQEVTWEWDGVL